MKKIVTLALAALFLLPLFGQGCGNCPEQGKHNGTHNGNPQMEVSRKVLGNAKTVYSLNDDYTISYRWNKNPKIGTYVLLVNIWDKKHKPVTNLNVTANSYMPSMRGSHDTGDIKMMTNKKKEYATPVNFVMLGEWEVELKIADGDKQLAKLFVKREIK